MKKQPMSHLLQQRYQSMQGWKRGAYRGSHGLPKTPRRALQSQGLHQTPSQERRLGCAMRKGPRGIADPENQHISNEKAFSGLGMWLGTSALWSSALPISKGPRHSAAGLTGDPRRVASPKSFHAHENH